jgi:hypothetical protein
MTLLMTNAEAETFREFHEDTLSDGAARFTMPIHFAGAFRTQNVLFAEPPTYDHFLPDYVKVTFGLLVESIGTGEIVIIEPEEPEEPEPPGYTPSLDFSNPLNSGYVALI